MKKRMVFALLLCLTLAGCKDTTARNVGVNLAVEEQSEVEFEMTMADRGDVQEILDVACTYNVTESATYSFKTRGATVEHVYVEKGDTVSVGDVLAVLDSSETANSLDDIAHRISMKQLEINQAEERRAFYIEKWKTLYYYTDQEQENRIERDKQIDSVNRSYDQTVARLKDDLSLLQIEYDEVAKQIDESRIVADMNGIVSFVEIGLEGSTITEEKDVIRVYNRETCLLTSDAVEDAHYFEEGKNYKMTSGYGKSEITFDVTPIKMDEWGEKLYFGIAEEGVVLSLLDTGHIYLTINESRNVVRIPSEALHMSGDKYYVYQIDQDGVRYMNYVNVGLIGGGFAEIKSGLSEGDVLVLKMAKKEGF